MHVRKTGHVSILCIRGKPCGRGMVSEEQLPFPWHKARARPCPTSQLSSTRVHQPVPGDTGQPEGGGFIAH